MVIPLVKRGQDARRKFYNRDFRLRLAERLKARTFAASRSGCKGRADNSGYDPKPRMCHVAGSYAVFGGKGRGRHPFGRLYFAAATPNVQHGSRSSEMEDNSMNERTKIENFHSGTSADGGSKAKSMSASEKLKSFGYSVSDLLRFAVPHRLIVTKLQKHQPIELSEKDASRILEIFEFADKVFGNRVKAQHWLREPCRAIDNVVPLDLLESDAGAELVKDELLRIEHGIYA
jgi:hypothetical protein